MDGTDVTRIKRERETPEVAAGVSRMIRALGRRLAAGDPVDLLELAKLREAIDCAERDAVAGQRETGFSWTEIGVGIGTTRQNAYQRFSNRKA